MFEPFDIIPTIESDTLNVCKDNNLSYCLTEVKSAYKGTITNTNYVKTTAYIPKLIELIQPEKTAVSELKNQIDTFEESVKQQENPESTLTVQAQTTGGLAIPRPLKPIGVALLFGIAFFFFFTSAAILYASLPTFKGVGAGAAAAGLLTFDTVKNIAIGILAIAVIFMALALAKVI